MNLALSTLDPVIRNTEFSSLSNALVPEEGETATSITITTSHEDSGITLSVAEDLSSVSVSGSYNGLFNDYGEYVSKGSSNLIETPTEFTNIDNLPPNKDFYLFEQDDTDHVIITYTVTIIYDRETISTSTLEEDLEFIGTFTHKVNNSVTLGYNVVSAYYV